MKCENRKVIHPRLSRFHSWRCSAAFGRGDPPKGGKPWKELGRLPLGIVVDYHALTVRGLDAQRRRPQGRPHPLGGEVTCQGLEKALVMQSEGEIPLGEFTSLWKASGCLFLCCLLLCRATWDCSLISLVCLCEDISTRHETDGAQVGRPKRAKHSARRVRST